MKLELELKTLENRSKKAGSSKKGFESSRDTKHQIDQTAIRLKEV